MKSVSDKWDLRYLRVAKEVSTWSKDPSTQVGAVTVKPHYGQILTQGYNGFPRALQDLPERLEERITKYKYTIHAEMNCIYNASLLGLSLLNAHMYIWGLPLCSECAKGIIQAGISKVIVCYPEKIHEPWISSWEMSKNMLYEAGCTISEYRYDSQLKITMYKPF